MGTAGATRISKAHGKTPKVNGRVETAAAADENRLAELFRGAQTLIEYTAENALAASEMDGKEFQALILRITRAREVFQTKGLKGDDEAQLIADFRALVQACRPVTADSIRDSLDETAGIGRQYIWWGDRITVAAAAVRRFTLVSFIALFTLLGVQILWVWGTYLVEQVEALQTENQKSLDAGIAAATAKLNSSAPKATALGKNVTDGATTAGNPANSDGELDTMLQNLMNQKDADREARMEAVTAKLDDWMRNLGQTESPSKSDTDNDAGLSPAYHRMLRNLVASNIDLVLLQAYILPLLYGFLGTCTFVLRQLIAETKAHTYRREMEITYWLRVFLGSLAGFAIGWFLRPNVGGDSLIHGLTPFALSFLAGYSVEVLFAGMDRLVSAFASAPQHAKG